MQVLGTAAWSLQRAITIFDNSGLILDKQLAEEACGALQVFFKSYAWLASFYVGRRLLLFRMRPKMHYLWHQAAQVGAWRLNPCCFDNFKEDLDMALSHFFLRAQFYLVPFLGTRYF